MNVVILGAGEIGFYLAETLILHAHDVCVIESDADVAAEANEKLDARVVHGNGASVSVLEEASIADCDVFLGLSSQDNTNLVSASLAKSLGADRSIARVHSDIQSDFWLFDFRKHFNIDYLFSSERLAAVELAKHIRNPNHLLVEEVARGRIELQQTRVDARCAATEHSLRDLKLPQRVRIGLIQRGDQLIIPHADEVLKGGDVVTLFGHPSKLQEVSRLLQRFPVEDETTRVVIFGGGEYGFALAQMLTGKRFRVRIFETDEKRCQYLSTVLENTTLIHADATSMRMLREEQVGEADFFVGATYDDEDNVMTCLQAKDLGVRHCLTLIHRSDYADAVMRVGAELGIIGAVSPRVATSKELMRFMTPDRHTSLVQLAGGSDVIEFTVRERSAIANRKVAETNLPTGSMFVSLTHGRDAVVPAAEDLLSPGDQVVAIVSPAAKKPFLRLIA